MKNTQLETLQALKSHVDDTIENWLTVDESKINDDNFNLEISINNKTFNLDVNADLYSIFQQFVDKSVKDEFEYVNGKNS